MVSFQTAFFVAGIRKACSGFVAGIHWLSRGIHTVCEFLLFVMMVTVCYDIVMRYVFHKPTSWSLELNEFLLCFFFFLVAADIFVAKRHIKLDLLFARMPEKVQTYVDIFICLCFMFLCTILVWRGIIMVATAHHFSYTTASALATPYWIPYISIPLGMGLLGLEALFKMIEDIRHAMSFKNIKHESEGIA